MSLRKYVVLLCPHCAAGNVSKCREAGCLNWMSDLPKMRADVGHDVIVRMAVEPLSLDQINALDVARAFARGDLS